MRRLTGQKPGGFPGYCADCDAQCPLTVCQVDSDITRSRFPHAEWLEVRDRPAAVFDPGEVLCGLDDRTEYRTSSEEIDDDLRSLVGFDEVG